MTENLPVRIENRQSLLLDPTRFESAQRAGRMMALSALFPAHLRAGGQETSIANAVLVMNIADRMREDPLAVAQNIYFVAGKPGWNASYMISRANQAGVFKGPIRWRFKGDDKSNDKGQPDYSGLIVTAYAKMAEDGEEVTAEASMTMARAEGWTKNTKYASMPRQMLQYRAATFLVRLYCPQVMLGISIADEIEDDLAARATDITPRDADSSEPAPAPKGAGDVIDATPQPVSKSSRKAAQDKFRKEQAKKEKAKPAPIAGKVEPAHVDEGDGQDDVADVAQEIGVDDMSEEVAGPYQQIVDALDDCKDLGEVEQTMDLFQDVVGFLAEAHVEVHDQLQAKADEARERVSGSDND